MENLNNIIELQLPKDVSRKPINILCLGDFQFGHRSALWPPDLKEWDGGSHNLNIGQEYLWECWIDMLDHRLPPELDLVVDFGETIEGTQRRENGYPLITADLEVQARAARITFEMLKDRVRKPTSEQMWGWYFLEGTHYHEGPSHIGVIPVAEGLKANTTSWGRALWNELLFDVAGIRMHFQHSCPVFKVYKGTMVEREMMWSRLAEAVRVYGNVRLVGRGHVHNCITLGIPIGKEWHEGFTIPGWELQIEYVTRFSPFRGIPHIGAVLVTVYPDREKMIYNIRTGETTKQPMPDFTVEAITYDYPVKEAIVL